MLLRLLVIFALYHFFQLDNPMTIECSINVLNNSLIATVLK